MLCFLYKNRFIFYDYYIRLIESLNITSKQYVISIQLKLQRNKLNIYQPL